MRLFSGESEGLPGVTVDRYGDFVVVQWLSAGRARPGATSSTTPSRSRCRPRGIYEQRRLRPLGGRGPPEPAVRARGEEAPVELVVEDGGCRFGVDVTAPLGVGLFPDMRLGWAAVAARAADRRVLNLFSYTGAFSVRAAKAGASEVVAVDVAAKAHARARRNYELSGLDPAKLETVTGDAVKTLERFASRGRRFDLVVCDPPTFSHGPGRAVLGGARSGAARRDQPRRARAGRLPGVRHQLDQDRRAPSWTARSARGRHAQAPTCASSSASALPPDYPVAPGFPEGNYLKFAVAIRGP